MITANPIIEKEVKLQTDQEEVGDHFRSHSNQRGEQLSRQSIRWVRTPWLASDKQGACYHFATTMTGPRGFVCLGNQIKLVVHYITEGQFDREQRGLRVRPFSLCFERVSGL